MLAGRRAGGGGGGTVSSPSGGRPCWGRRRGVSGGSPPVPGGQAKAAAASLPPAAGEPGRLRRDALGVELAAGERRCPEEFSWSSPGVGRGGTEMLSRCAALRSGAGPGRYALQTEPQPALPPPALPPALITL